MKNAETKSNESMPRLGNFKKMLSRDEMKKVMGGYTYCKGSPRFCHGSEQCISGKCVSGHPPKAGSPSPIKK